MTWECGGHAAALGTLDAATTGTKGGGMAAALRGAYRSRE